MFIFNNIYKHFKKGETMINSIENSINFGQKEKRHNVDRLIVPTGLALTGASIAIVQRKEVEPKHVLGLNEKFADVFTPNNELFTKKENNAINTIRETIKSNKARNAVVEVMTKKVFTENLKKLPLETILGTNVRDFKRQYKEEMMVINSLKLNYKDAKAKGKNHEELDELGSLLAEKLHAFKEKRIKLNLIKKADKKGNISRKAYRQNLVEFATQPLPKALKTLKGRLPKVISLPKVALFAGLGVFIGTVFNKFIGFSK